MFFGGVGHAAWVSNENHGGGNVGSQNPGVVRLPTLVGFDADPPGNLYTNHSTSLLVTNLELDLRSIGITQSVDSQ